MKIVIDAPDAVRKVERTALAELVDVVEVMDADTFSRERALLLLQGNALFGERYGIVCDRVGETASLRSDLVATLEELAQDAPVVVFENGIDAEFKKKLKHLNIPIEELKVPAKVSFSPFALTDCIAKRNKKDAWMRWQEARASGQEAEYLHAMVLWQLRAMLVASRFSEAESGMKSFTYNKAKRAGSHYTAKELEDLSRECVELLAISRSHNGPALDILVERFILAL